jgi:hypothetical protein
MQAINVAPEQIVSNLVHGQVPFSKPPAERIGVAKLPPDALARIVL